MSEKRQKTLVADRDGSIRYASGGVLEPGFRAALELLKLERRIAVSEAEVEATKTVDERIASYGAVERIKGADYAINILEEQGVRLGLVL